MDFLMKIGVVGVFFGLMVLIMAALFAVVGAGTTAVDAPGMTNETWDNTTGFVHMLMAVSLGLIGIGVASLYAWLGLVKIQEKNKQDKE